MSGSDRLTSLPARSAGRTIGVVSPDRASIVVAAVAAVAADPAGPHSLAALAERAAVSRRHLTRLFVRHLQCPPGRFVELVRVTAAGRFLAETDEPVTSIGLRVGFASAETMRRAFVRARGVPPSVYRHHARSRPAEG
jgi:transcriptional regulator GlxA family with amidase domain